MCTARPLHLPFLAPRLSSLPSGLVPGLAPGIGFAGSALPPLLPPPQRRHAGSARRNNRRLRLRPAPSMVPEPMSAGEHIVFNPPAALPSVHHTPLKFLPKNDRRRELYGTSTADGAGAVGAAVARPASPAHSLSHYVSPARQAAARLAAAAAAAPSQPATEEGLPPALRELGPRKFHVTPAQMEEMRQLRVSDAAQWTIVRLAERFACSTFFVRLVCQEQNVLVGIARSAAHEGADKRDRWGPGKKAALADRVRRRESWWRDA